VVKKVVLKMQKPLDYRAASRPAAEATGGIPKLHHKSFDPVGQLVFCYVGFFRGGFFRPRSYRHICYPIIRSRYLT
jgi:hypothetical protein